MKTVLRNGTHFIACECGEYLPVSGVVDLFCNRCGGMIQTKEELGYFNHFQCKDSPAQPALSALDKQYIENGVDPIRVIHMNRSYRYLSCEEHMKMIRIAIQYKYCYELKKSVTGGRAYPDPSWCEVWRETVERSQRQQLRIEASRNWKKLFMGSTGGECESYYDWMRRLYIEHFNLTTQPSFCEPLKGVTTRLDSVDAYDYFKHVYNHGKLQNEVAELSANIGFLKGRNKQLIESNWLLKKENTELLAANTMEIPPEKMSTLHLKYTMKIYTNELTRREENAQIEAGNVMIFPASNERNGRKDMANVVQSILTRSMGLKKSVYILGGQGTGKTMLAKEIARTHVRTTGGVVRRVDMSMHSHDKYFIAGERCDVCIIDAADMKKILPLVKEWSTMSHAPKYIIVSQDVDAIVAFQPESRRSLAVLLR